MRLRRARDDNLAAYALMASGVGLEHTEPLAATDPTPSMRVVIVSALAIAVIAIFSFFYVRAGGIVFPNDDAYIYLHSAEVLRTGHDASYPGVPALTGVTSAAFLAALALVEIPISSPETALYVLCMLFAIAYITGIYAIAVNSGCSPAVASAIAAGSVIIAGSIFQLMNGLDTGLAMSAVAWDLALLIATVSRINSCATVSRMNSDVVLAALAGLMVFIRPELVILSFASMAVLMLDQEIATRRKAVYVASFGAAVAPFLIWYWVQTGIPIPSSIDAKEYFFAEASWPLGRKVQAFMPQLAYIAMLGFPLWVCIAFIRPRWLKLICGVFVGAFLIAYFFKLPAGVGGRYSAILVPVWMKAIADGLTSPKAWQRKLANFCVGLCVIATGWILTIEGRTFERWTKTFGTNVRQVAAWSNTNLPSGSVLLVHDAGYMAFAGKFRLVDMVGLKTPASIAVNRQITFQNPERRGVAIATIADNTHPQYLVDVAGWDRKFGISDGLRANGWALTEIYESPASSNSEFMIYRVYVMEKLPIR